jgi:hypothetical protein
MSYQFKFLSIAEEAKKKQKILMSEKLVCKMNGDDVEMENEPKLPEFKLGTPFSACPSYRFLLWHSSMNHPSAHIQLCNHHVQSGKETRDNASSYCKNTQSL